VQSENTRTRQQNQNEKKGKEGTQKQPPSLLSLSLSTRSSPISRCSSSIHREMAKSSLNLVLVSMALCLAFVVAAQSAITIRSVDRLIDLSTQLSNQALTINFINSGSEPVSEFQYVIQKSLADKVSLFVAKDESGEELSITSGTFQAGGDT